MVKTKLYLHYDDSDDAELHTTLKLTLPTKWAAQPSDKVLAFFVQSYNGKHADHPLDAAAVHFVNAQGAPVFAGVPCAEAFEDRGDYFVRPGAAEPAPAAPPAAPPAAAAAPAPAPAPADDGLLRCRRFGCKQQYREEDNANDACHFHSGAALFHQTKKGWSCCSEASNRWGWDWDSFNELPTCCVGRHSTEDPGSLLAESPTVAAGREMAAGAGASAAGAAGAAAAPLKSIDSYNEANPAAASATQTAQRMAGEAKRREREDGTVYCVNNGCRQWFREEDNPEDACRFHGVPPTFHDRSKQWGCCGRRGGDFDELLAVPGCQVGAHRAGTA